MYAYMITIVLLRRMNNHKQHWQLHGENGFVRSLMIDGFVRIANATLCFSQVQTVFPNLVLINNIYCWCFGRMFSENINIKRYLNDHGSTDENDQFVSLFNVEV